MREDTMTASDTRSLHEIRRETEQTRADLTATVDELRGTVTDTATDIKNRLRPEAIKAEVSSYIRSRGEQLLHDVTEAARRNPLQAIAVGASVAYPVLRMVRAIPLPILMIGAGLFLAGSKTGRDFTQKASDLAEDFAGEARQRAQQLGEQTSQAAADLVERASDAAASARDSITGSAEQLQRAGADATAATRSRLEGDLRIAQDTAGDAGDAVSSGIHVLKDKLSDAADSSISTVRETASHVADTMRDTQTRAAEAGREFLDSARERLSEAGEKTARSLREQVENNPLLVAGVGLLIGGLIASALPKSATEEELLGQTSSAMKRRAREAAAAGFETAKGATGEILSNVAQQAAAEGLTPEGLAEGAEDVGQRLQRVAERAVTTAFDPDQHSEHNQHTESTGGGKQHG
jgi:hypothetical protein